MSSPGSITLLVEQLRSSDPAIRDAAAEQIWQRHFSNLLALACRHLDQRLRVRVDERTSQCVCRQPPCTRPLH